jgi:type II secretory pathway pseudopilin PulG
MMRMRKGMTLVEVVIAFLLLSLLAAIFLQNMTRQYALMARAKAITENVFQAAKKVETETRDIRDALDRGVAYPLGAPHTYTMFSGGADERDITYYPVMEAINDIEGNPSSKTLYAVVADVRQPEFVVPEITNFQALLRSGGVVVGGAYADSSAVIDVEADVDDPGLLLMFKYQWYISDLGFPLTWKNVEMSDPGIGINVPMFPNDYSIIPYATSSQLAITPDMAGRHALCVVTPASVSGKMGKAVLTKPIYIYGLPVLGGLKAHYDASLVELPTGVFGAYSWQDISGGGADAFYYGSVYPVLSIADFPKRDDREYPTKAKRMAFSGWGWMMAPGLVLNAADNFTMFAVAKSNGWFSSDIISNGAAWRFDMSSYPGAVDGQWRILGLSSGNKRTMGKEASLVGGAFLGDRSTGGMIMIGGSNVELAELIIYNTVLTDVDWLKVTKYLGEKYNLG